MTFDQLALASPKGHGTVLLSGKEPVFIRLITDIAQMSLLTVVSTVFLCTKNALSEIIKKF